MVGLKADEDGYVIGSIFKIVDNVMEAVRAWYAFTHLILKPGIESMNLNARKYQTRLSSPLP